MLLLFSDTQNSMGEENTCLEYEGHKYIIFKEGFLLVSVPKLSTRVSFSLSLRMTQCAWGSLRDCYLNTLVVLTGNPALRAKTGRKEERLKDIVRVNCWTWNQRTLNVFKLLAGVGRKLALTSHWLIRMVCLTPGHSSLPSPLELPSGAWVLRTGGMRACQDLLTQPCLKTGHVEWNRRVKLNSKSSMPGCYLGTVQGQACFSLT